MSETFFSPFCFASPEIIGVKVDHRQTDKFFDTIYWGVCQFFLSVHSGIIKCTEIKTSLMKKFESLFKI